MVWRWRDPVLFGSPNDHTTGAYEGLIALAMTPVHGVAKMADDS